MSDIIKGYGPEGNPDSDSGSFQQGTNESSPEAEMKICKFRLCGDGQDIEDGCPCGEKCTITQDGIECECPPIPDGANFENVQLVHEVCSEVQINPLNLPEPKKKSEFLGIIMFGGSKDDPSKPCEEQNMECPNLETYFSNNAILPEKFRPIEEDGLVPELVDVWLPGMEWTPNGC